MCLPIAPRSRTRPHELVADAGMLGLSVRAGRTDRFPTVRRDQAQSLFRLDLVDDEVAATATFAEGRRHPQYLAPVQRHSQRSLDVLNRRGAPGYPHAASNHRYAARRFGNAPSRTLALDLLSERGVSAPCAHGDNAAHNQMGRRCV